MRMNPSYGVLYIHLQLLPPGISMLPGGKGSPLVVTLTPRELERNVVSPVPTVYYRATPSRTINKEAIKKDHRSGQ